MEKKNYIVPAIERAFKIMELLANKTNGLMMSEMNSLKLPNASLYRMLATMVSCGYIVKEDNDRYRLSRKLLSLGYQATDETYLVEKSLNIMRKLRDDTQESVMLGVLYGNEGVVIESVKSNQAVCVTIKIGHHFPIHSAAPAKAMLAFLPPEDADTIINKIKYTKFTENTIINADELKKSLVDIKKTAIAFDKGEELDDLYCVASPILSEKNQVLAAIWIGGPKSRLNEKKLQACGKLVKKAALEIQNKIQN